MFEKFLRHIKTFLFSTAAITLFLTTVTHHSRHLDTTNHKQFTERTSSQRPELDLSIWLGRDHDKLSDDTMSQFIPRASEHDLHMMNDLIKVYKRITERNHLTYFLMHGTLLGSVRHHGMIPWDDDFDVIMAPDERPKVKKVLEDQLSYPYKLNTEVYPWKMWNDASPHQAFRKSWRFPFLDIYFYKESNGRISHSDVGFDMDLSERDVFPLKKRPFWNMMLNVPNRYEKIIEDNFGTEICKATGYSHITGKKVRRPASTECRQLYRYFPFTFRSSINQSLTVEHLTIHDKLLKSFTVHI